jgi:hypothetical protein
MALVADEEQDGGRRTADGKRETNGECVSVDSVGYGWIIWPALRSE